MKMKIVVLQVVILCVCLQQVGFQKCFMQSLTFNLLIFLLFKFLYFHIQIRASYDIHYSYSDKAVERSREYVLDLFHGASVQFNYDLTFLIEVDAQNAYAFTSGSHRSVSECLQFGDNYKMWKF